MLRKLFLLVIFTFLTITLSATEKYSEKYEVAFVTDSIDREVSRLLKKFDSDAYLIVDVKLQTQTPKPLPETPFAISNLTIENENGVPVVDFLKIGIYTKMQKLPEPVSQLLQDIGDKYGVAPNIKINSLPDFYLEEKRQKKAEIEELDQVTLTKQFLRKNSIALGIAGFALLFLFLITIFTVKQFNSKKLKKIVDDGSAKISEAIQSGSGFSSSPAITQMSSAEENSSASSLASRPDTSGQDNKILSELPTDSLVAILSDCYWSEQDQYANYLWSNMSLQQRTQLLEAHPFLKDYSSFFCNKSAKNLNLHNDPYYLNPIKIDHLNNESLTQYCRQHPVLLQTLSSLRTDSFKLTARERIQFQDFYDPNATLPKTDLEKASASPLRKLTKKAKLSIQTIAEETEILTLNLDFETKEQVPSLGWLLELSDEKAKEILSSFSATDLATAWVAPTHVLEKLRSHIPEKKWNLMASYQENIKPRRESPVFMEIHKRTMQALSHTSSHGLQNDFSQAA